MMCALCNERPSNTRCEGCQRLYCLPCMNKHHGELMTQFEVLFGFHNELKQELNVVESNWRNKKTFPCLSQIDQWEQEVISRVQQIAENARLAANDAMAKHLSDTHRRLEQLAFDMQQRQQEGNYLDNDVNEMRNRLEQLNITIKQANEQIQINYSGTNRINWNSLLCVKTDKKSTSKQSSDSHVDLSDFFYEEPTIREKIWKNIKKLIRNRNSSHTVIDRNSILSQTASPIFEPIVLTSVGAPLNPFWSKSNIYAITHISDGFEQYSLQKEESSYYANFKLSGHEQLLQGSVAYK